MLFLVPRKMKKVSDLQNSLNETEQKARLRDFEKDQNSFQKAEDLKKSLTVSDIAEMIGKTRANTSKIMQSLKEKEILLNPEGAGQVIDNGRTVSPRTWIVNPYIMICAPRKNKVQLDRLTMRLFQNSLKNLKDQNGKIYLV